MLKRKIDVVFERFWEDPRRSALLITGARQVGKTFSIRQFGKNHFKSFIEIDFLVEWGGRVLPLEAKSGDDCESHVALTKLMKAPEYGIDEAYVLNKFERVREVSGIVYYPIYFLMFIHRTALPDKLVYRVEG